MENERFHMLQQLVLASTANGEERKAYHWELHQRKGEYDYEELNLDQCAGLLQEHGVTCHDRGPVQALRELLRSAVRVGVVPEERLP